MKNNITTTKTYTNFFKLNAFQKSEILNKLVSLSPAEGIVNMEQLMNRLEKDYNNGTGFVAAIYDYLKNDKNAYLMTSINLAAERSFVGGVR